MAFANGTVAFKRFAVQGGVADQPDDSFIEKLAAHAITADSVQTADKTQFGWVTGDHILDTRFAWGKNAVADGLHFALRIDTHKPPADLIRGYQRLAEQAMLEASGREFLSRAERREARAQALARAEEEARQGVFRKMKQVPVFWDFKRGEVYLGSGASSVVDPFMLLFRQTFDCSAVPLSSGELAARWSVRVGEASAFDGCRPAFFVHPPELAESSDEVALPGEARSRDFLGTEWLTWLWYAAQVESSEVATPEGEAVTVLFEKSLQMECAFKLNGSVAITADGPTRQPEAPVALAAGKRPVRAGLQLAVHGDVYGLGVRGDAMNVSGVQLPQPQEGPDPRGIFEERIEHLRSLIEALDGLYTAFLKRRLSSKWSQHLAAIRAWIASGGVTDAHSAPLEAAS